MTTFQALKKKAGSARKIVAQTTKALGERLGRDLYSDSLEAFWEILQNSLDASQVAEKMPHCHVLLQDVGENELFPNQPCLVVWDSATGIREEKLIPIARDDDDNRFGIGRIGIDAILDPETKKHIIITRCKHERNIRIYDFDGGNFFASAEGSDVVVCKQDELPESLGIPSSPFTMYIVPGWNQSCFTIEQLQTFISERGPLHEWEITINEEPVEQYEFDEVISDETSYIREFGSSIEVRLGLKPHAKAPGIWLVDKDTRRKVVELKTGSAKLPSIFQHHNLTGYIFIPGLETFAVASRHGVKATFFQAGRMLKLYEAIRIKFIEEVEALLQTTQQNQQEELFDQIEQAFSSAYKPTSTTAKPTKDSGNAGVNRRRRRRRASTKIYIQNQSYTLSSTTRDHNIPTEIRDETIMLFNGNQTIQRIMAMTNRRIQLISIIELICECFAANQHIDNVAAARELKFTLIENVISQMS